MKCPFTVLDPDGDEIANCQDEATAQRIANRYHGVILRECDICGDPKEGVEITHGGDFACECCREAESDPAADYGDWRYHQTMGA